jgi:hypothetical protein
VLAAVRHGADMIPVCQNHAELCVQIQISNRFCGGGYVLGYLIAMAAAQCAAQTNRFPTTSVSEDVWGLSKPARLCVI